MMFVSVKTECKHKTIIEGTKFLPKCASISLCAYNFLESCEERRGTWKL